jgi:NADH-quinone oxidoreductase subunit A
VPENYGPLAILVLLVAGLGAIILTIGIVIRPQLPTAEKLSTYESGMRPIGEAHHRITVRFYIIAMLFVLFDIEVVFLYPWAVVLDRLGVFGLIEMGIFVALLLVAYGYAWRKGALDWVR